MSKNDIFLKKLLLRAIKNQDKVIVNRLPSLKKSSKSHKAEKTIHINCRECIHFYTTWEIKRPHGCNIHGFKSSKLPSQVVFSSSGSQCLLFEQKLSK